MEVVDEENGIPLLPLRADKKKGTEKSCILVVGTTGTGKTSTVNIYTGSNLRTGDTAQAVTGNTVTVEDQIHPGEPAWIDNPGWADTEGRSDALVFKELLRHMQNNKLYWVKAVVWCVLPQVRMDALLQAQAKFIDMFTVKGDTGKIWSNVLILCKGKLQKVSEDCQGAMTAAKKVHVHAEPQMMGYQFADPEVLEGTSETIRKHKLRMLTEEEIRGELETAISKMPPCLQVVFANQQCRACGQTGDPRLMEDICHRQKVAGHTGTLGQRFSKAQVGVAAGVGAAGVIGLSTAAGLVTGGEMILLGLPMVMGPGACMGGHRFLNTSSTSPAPCGGVKITDMRYKCCGMQELSQGGCTDKCDKCEALWGERKPGPGPPGCVLIRNPGGLPDSKLEFELVLKDHDLVDIVKS